MKFSTIFIVILLMLSVSVNVGCKKEEKPRYNYTNFQEEPTKKIKKIKKTEKIQNNEGEDIEYSFWFVVWEVKGKGTKVNSIVVQKHPGFSIKEFKEEHGEDNFINNLVEISYDTYLVNTQ